MPENPPFAELLAQSSCGDDRAAAGGLDSAQVLSLMEQFELAWHKGGRPDLARFLAGQAPEPALLLPLVHIDLERRLKAGEQARVEDYLARFPILGEDDNALLQLIQAEYRLRRRREPGLHWSDYGSRFPRFASRLDRGSGSEPPSEPCCREVGPASFPFGPTQQPRSEPALMHSTPASLLERLKQPQAQREWERFVDLYTPLLYFWACRAGLRGDDAADLVQDVFVILLQKLPTFTYDPHKSFRSWLRTIAVNRWRDLQRRQAQTVPGARAVCLDELSVPDSAEALFEAEYQRHLIGRATEIMRTDFQPATWKAAWSLVVEGKPASEVAGKLGLSIEAVYAARSRVLRRLREELSGLLE